MLFTRRNIQYNKHYYMYLYIVHKIFIELIPTLLIISDRISLHAWWTGTEITPQKDNKNKSFQCVSYV